MPLALSPNNKFSLVLKSDQHLPEKDQPRFIFKILNGHEQCQRIVQMDEMEKMKLDKNVSAFEYMRKIFEVLGNFIIGWENINGIEFAVENIDCVLRSQEALELIYRAWGYRPVDLKNSDSQSPTASDASASPAVVPAAEEVAKTPSTK